MRVRQATPFCPASRKGEGEAAALCGERCYDVTRAFFEGQAAVRRLALNGEL